MHALNPEIDYSPWTPEEVKPVCFFLPRDFLVLMHGVRMSSSFMGWNSTAIAGNKLSPYTSLGEAVFPRRIGIISFSAVFKAKRFKRSEIQSTRTR
ncbi:hypothetical protein BJX96DRAFT_152141 [Aspergillus floccosus]